MFHHRCPYCGNSFQQLTKSALFRCPSCSRKLAMRRMWPVALAALVPLALFGTAIEGLSVGMRWVCAAGILVLVAGVCLWTPFQKGEEHIHEHPDHLAAIRWMPYFKTGLLPFLIQSGEVLPACFVDEQGNPVSHMWCVSLEHRHWLLRRRYHVWMHLTAEEAPEELMQEGNRFYLFYHERKVAQGMVIPASKVRRALPKVA